MCIFTQKPNLDVVVEPGISTLVYEGEERPHFRRLASLPVRFVCLPFISKITPEDARELARFRGIGVSLGVTSIDTETARELAKFEGRKLEVGVRGGFGVETAQELANFTGQELSVSCVSAKTAKELAEFKGETLSLSLSRETLDTGTAHALAGFKGRTLLLRGLDNFRKEAIEALLASSFALHLGDITLE